MLKNALEYENLQEKYNNLQQLFNEISEKNTTLQSEVETANTELNSLRTRKETVESSKNDLERNYSFSAKHETESLLSTQRDYNNFRKDDETDRNKYEEQINNLRKENVAHTDHISKLKSELTAVTIQKEQLLSNYNLLERSLEEEKEIRSAQLHNFIGEAHKNRSTFGLMSKDMKRAIEKIKKLSDNVSTEETKRLEFEKLNDALQNTVSNLTEEKKSLETSLNDTTYQLQYLLTYVQRKNYAVPSVLRESVELLTAVQVSPNIPHDQLVFKDVAELQDLNAKLVSEVKNLKGQVSHANTQRNNDAEIFTNELNEAKQTIQSLSSTSEDLQKESNAILTEYSNYKKLMIQLDKGGDVRAKVGQMQRQYESEHNKMEEYCDAANYKINHVLKLYVEESKSARESKTRLNRAEDVIKNIRYVYIKANERVEQLEKELQESYNENSLLLSQLESTTDACNSTKDTMGTQSINHCMEVFADTSSESAKQYKDTIAKLNCDFQHARDLLSIAKKELDGYKSIDRQENKLKLAETSTATANNQIDNSLKVVKEKETLEEEKKKVEESLRTKICEYMTLENEYHSIFHKAYQLQLKKRKTADELNALRVESPTLKAKIAELEAELATVNKTVSDNSIELTRLKDQNSMIANKNNSLQKKIDLIKSQASSYVSSTAAYALKASSSTPGNEADVDTKELNSTPIAKREDTLNEEEELSDTPRGKKHEREDNEERVIVYPLAKKVKI